MTSFITPTLYVGEGATTASECAVLGTHAIYVNTLNWGDTDEEEEKYQLDFTTFLYKEDMEIKAFSRRQSNFWKTKN